MGIWLHRRYQSETIAPTIYSPFIASIVATKITLGTAENAVGLLVRPSTNKSLYLSKKTAGLILAVDGKITHIDHKPIHDVIEYIFDLYRADGMRFLYRLSGDFTCIFLDDTQQQAFLYRPTSSGIPLYYCARSGWVSASSNPALLLRRSDLKGALNTRQLSQLFFIQNGRWNAPLFSEIDEVAGGSIVTVNASGLTVVQSGVELYAQAPLHDNDVISHYRRLLEDAVQRHLLSSKQYGIMLSSGMDSGSLAFVASRLLRKQHGMLQAFTWSLPNFAADETVNVKRLCAALGIRLHVFDGEAHRPFSNLDALALKPDYPFTNLFDPMAHALYRLAQHSGVNVLFNGHFGDNLFKDDRFVLAELARDGKWWLLLKTITMVLWRLGSVNRFLKAPTVRTLVKYILAYQRLNTALTEPPPWLSPFGVENWRASTPDAGATEDASTNLLKRILDKAERDNGMQRRFTAPYGIERIEPYRDEKLLSFTLALPSYYSFAQGQSKFFAREAMRDRLPEFIRLQPRRGILVPFARDGYARYLPQIKERLFDETDAWSHYVSHAWMQNTLQKNPQTVTGKEIMVIWYALHLSPWMRSVRPGGKFYEGKA